MERSRNHPATPEETEDDLPTPRDQSKKGGFGSPREAARKDPPQKGPVGGAHGAGFKGAHQRAPYMDQHLKDELMREPDRSDDEDEPR